jgi:hypothetical protein
MPSSIAWHHGGEALGKSALLKHASWRAAESGFRTLATVGVESEAELAVRCCTTVHVYDAVVIGAGYGESVGIVAPAPDLRIDHVSSPRRRRPFWPVPSP